MGTPENRSEIVRTLATEIKEGTRGGGLGKSLLLKEKEKGTQEDNSVTWQNQLMVKGGTHFG